jgi:hypothetical protein
MNEPEHRDPNPTLMPDADASTAKAADTDSTAGGKAKYPDRPLAAWGRPPNPGQTVVIPPPIDPTAPPGTALNPIGWYQWRSGKLRGSDTPVGFLCAAQLPGARPFRYCLRRRDRGQKRCHRHNGCGGKRGIAHHSYRHGKYCEDRYVRYLSGTLADAYERQLADPDYLSLHSEISVLRTVVGELLSKMDKGEGESLWDRLVKTHRRLASAVRDGDGEGVKIGLGALAQVIETGAADAGLRKQLQNSIKVLVAASKGEWKRLHDLSQFLPRQTVERIFAIENQLLVETFGDRKKVLEYRKRVYTALLPVLGRSAQQ